MQRPSENRVAMTERPTKITFAEMREMGIRGLLIYCARTTAAATRSRSAAMRMRDCPISRSASPAGPAASEVQTCDRISIGVANQSFRTAMDRTIVQNESALF